MQSPKKSSWGTSLERAKFMLVNSLNACNRLTGNMWMRQIKACSETLDTKELTRVLLRRDWKTLS